jgi:hypothetical protein
MLHKAPIVFALVGALSPLAQPGMAQKPSSVHEGNWPIQNGFDRQPTGNDQDVTQDQAREIDRLYDQLLSTGDKTQSRPRLKRAR